MSANGLQGFDSSFPFLLQMFISWLVYTQCGFAWLTKDIKDKIIKTNLVDFPHGFQTT